MKHTELKMRCDLSRTGANSHRVTSLYANVINTINLYLMDTENDDCFSKGVDALHKLNTIIGTTAKFTDIVASYVPDFEEQWSRCLNDECLGGACPRLTCVKEAS